MPILPNANNTTPWYPKRTPAGSGAGTPPKGTPGYPVATNRGGAVSIGSIPTPRAIKGGATAKTGTGWIGQYKAQPVKATPFKSFDTNRMMGIAGQTQAYNFRSPQQIQAATAQAGTAQAGDWGLDSAANAQAAIIRAWGAQNADAAMESSIARGMGRSGAADNAVLRAKAAADLEVANQHAQAAAEAGRINSQIAQSNAANVTQANIATAGFANEAAIRNAEIDQQQQELESQYNLAWRSGDMQLAGMLLDAWDRSESQRLNYLGFDEGRRQFNETNALARTDSDRGYQMDRLGYNEGIRQFNVGAGTDRYNAVTGRYNGMNDAGLGWSTLGENARQFDAGAANDLALQTLKGQQEVESAQYNPAYLNAQTAAGRLQLDTARARANALSGGYKTGLVGGYVFNPKTGKYELDPGVYMPQKYLSTIGLGR